MINEKCPQSIVTVSRDCPTHEALTHIPSELGAVFLDCTVSTSSGDL